MKNKIYKFITILLELGKIKITFPVAATTFLGYFLKTTAFDVSLLLTTVGLFFIASASAALNHVQDQDIDAMMIRTQDRPLPKARISENAVLGLIVVWFSLGSILLYFGANLTAVILGWFALFWYNAVYTPLKRATALAVVPGALIGAVPPIVGWVGAGGQWYEKHALLLGAFMFLWQIPHFWMLLVQKTSDFQRAGLPIITARFSPKVVHGFILTGIALMLCAAIAFPVFELMALGGGEIVIYILCISLVVYYGIIQETQGLDFKEKKPFVAINIFALGLLLTIFFDALIA